MPNLRDIRKRIRSIKNTQQITRAMKMVAAARLRRAQENALAARPYATELAKVLHSVAARADVAAEPMFQPVDAKRAAVVVISSDRGLCGSFNTNLCKAAAAKARGLVDEGWEARLFTVGKKGRDYFRRRGFHIVHERVNLFVKLAFGHARQLAEDLIALYRGGEYGTVLLAYNEFKNVLQPNIVIEPLLPIRHDEAGAGAVHSSFQFEPEPERILSALIPAHLHTQVWRALLESFAAEQAARMTAMEGATKNAGELIERLTLNMNKVRQASITRELIEVVSGAQALEG